MKFLKITTLLLIISFLNMSLDVYAQGATVQEAPPLEGFAGSHMHSSSGRRDVSRPPNFKPTWKLDVKLASLKDVGILGDKLKGDEFGFIQDIVHFFEDLPDVISRVHMYGNGKTKNTTMLVFGNINNAWLEDYIVKHLYNDEHSQLRYTKKVLSSGLKDITRLTIQPENGKKEKIVYFSNVTSGMYVLGSNIFEIRRWRDYPRSVSSWTWPNASTLLSLQMILNPTLKNLQKDGAENIYMLQSNVFKESKDINISIKETDDNIFIGGYIATQKPNQVEGLKDIFTNILTANNQKNTQSIKKTLLKNLKINKGSSFLKISSTIYKSEFKKNDLY